MSDEPWKAQPSKIILPVDRLVIEIDNRVEPARVNFLPSREMPIPFVINVFANLIAQLSAQLGAALQGGIPPAKPADGTGNGAR